MNHQTIAAGAFFTLERALRRRTNRSRTVLRRKGQPRLNDTKDDSNVETDHQDRRNHFREDRPKRRVIQAEANIDEKTSPRRRNRLFQPTNHLKRTIDQQIRTDLLIVHGVTVGETRIEHSKEAISRTSNSSSEKRGPRATRVDPHTNVFLAHSIIIE